MEMQSIFGHTLLRALCDNRFGNEFPFAEDRLAFMAVVKDWLNQKFRDWEKLQGKAQSYYAFARFLGVSQTSLAAWMDGAVEPQDDELALLAEKLGAEIYNLTGTKQPQNREQDRFALALMGIPAGLRDRLSEAVIEISQTIREKGLAPDSIEAKRTAVEIFLKHGIRLTG
jgi:transcriptional regulator with XRE-family HTH domain